MNNINLDEFNYNNDNNNNNIIMNRVLLQHLWLIYRRKVRCPPKRNTRRIAADRKISIFENLRGIWFTCNLTLSVQLNNFFVN